MLWLMQTVVALADPTPGDLAPGPTELRDGETTLRARLDQAEALERPASRLQNAWAVLEPAPKPCTDLERRALSQRLQRFGGAWRDAVQRARVSAERLTFVAAAPTVAPLMDDRSRSEVADLLTRSLEQTRRYSTWAAWERRYGPPRCDGAIEPVDGLSDPLGREEPGAAVVWAEGGGVVCPGEVPAEGRAVVLEAGCWQPAAPCTCTPTPLASGAVLAPTP